MEVDFLVKDTFSGGAEGTVGDGQMSQECNTITDILASLVIPLTAVLTALLLRELLAVTVME